MKTQFSGNFTSCLISAVVAFGCVRAYAAAPAQAPAIESETFDGEISGNWVNSANDTDVIDAPAGYAAPANGCGLPISGAAVPDANKVLALAGEVGRDFRVEVEEPRGFYVSDTMVQVKGPDKPLSECVIDTNAKLIVAFEKAIERLGDDSNKVEVPVPENPGDTIFYKVTVGDKTAQ